MLLILIWAQSFEYFVGVISVFLQYVYSELGRVRSFLSQNNIASGTVMKFLLYIYCGLFRVTDICIPSHTHLSCVMSNEELPETIPMGKGMTMVRVQTFKLKLKPHPKGPLTLST